MTAQRSVLFAVFLLSGFTGLIYESLWTHYLKLYLGHAAIAQSLVLATFMGGMALGAWLVSLLGPRLRNLLMAYALAEAAIGACALSFHDLFQRMEQWSFDTAFPALGSPGAVEWLQWGIAVALLAPPSIVLGATFPLMSGAVLRRFPGADGGNLAMLYFTNSIGAAIGVLVASFLLIGWLGLPGTLALGGMLNLVIASFTAGLARTPENAGAARVAVRAAPPKPEVPFAGIAPLFFAATRPSVPLLARAFVFSGLATRPRTSP